MLIRTFPVEWNDLEQMEIDIFRVQMLDRKFTRLINSFDEDEENSFRSNLILARGILENAIIQVKNLFDSTEFNNYIREVKEKYNLMIDNLGRANKVLDTIEKETFPMMEHSKTTIINEAKNMIYAKTLNEFMNHLVFYPIYNGYIRYLKFKGKKEVKNEEGKIELRDIKRDEKLLLYFIFYEFFKSSEVLGALSRQERKEMSSLGYTSLIGGKTKEGELSDMPTNPEVEQEFVEPSNIPDEFEVFK